jgi:ribA/ribD-fused uncharacterized protein
MSNKICGFFGKKRFLSNFFLCKIDYNNFEYLSVEAAYQAAKSENPFVHEDFSKMSASEAKSRGRLLKIRSDWDSVKLEIMRELVYKKFHTNEILMDLLLKTKGKYLEETNTWGDVFWGVYKGKGENFLGKILMKVRDDEIKENVYV